jgi:hypothetical protein
MLDIEMQNGKNLPSKAEQRDDQMSNSTPSNLQASAIALP